MKDIYLVSMVRVTIPDNASERLEQVLAFMSQHCADATLASVAAHFNFHPNTVSGLLKRETGKSFGDTLREIRMERALSLLDAQEIPVAQVAHLCGYENPSNFYRVFKEAFGMTPRAYMLSREGRPPADGMEADAFDDDFGADDPVGAVENEAAAGAAAGANGAGEDESTPMRDEQPPADLPRRKVRIGEPDPAISRDDQAVLEAADVVVAHADLAPTDEVDAADAAGETETPDDPEDSAAPAPRDTVR